MWLRSTVRGSAVPHAGELLQAAHDLGPVLGRALDDLELPR